MCSTILLADRKMVVWGTSVKIRVCVCGYSTADFPQEQIFPNAARSLTADTDQMRMCTYKHRQSDHGNYEEQRTSM